MKKLTIHIIVILLITLSIWSCSTKKNGFLNRTLHSTATKYNVLYNGRVAYDTQKKQIDDAYQDDFYKILPIEPLDIKEETISVAPPGSKKSTTKSSSSGFKRAEEKAVKAIQKHSMNIAASEKNKQIDDAYLLLGKARYYDQRFVPALETFKYMIKKYPKSKLFNIARIWEAKTLVRLGQEEDAIYKLDRYLTKTKDLPDAIRVDAHTALAMAYTTLDSTQQIINNLNSALFYANKLSKNKITTYDAQGEVVGENIANSLNKNLGFSKVQRNQVVRNAFILAQLYRQQNKIDSSNIVFDKIATFKKPYRYSIYAQIERAKNYDAKNDDTETILASLEKLTHNRDNRPYLDGVFFQLGKINLVNNEITKATDFFKKSLRTELAKDVQKSFAYEELGNINFDKANFQHAGSYYDSVLAITKNPNTKRNRKIKRKRKSLDEVIRLENIANKNDSILTLAGLSKDEQSNFFQKYIDKLKKKEKEEKIIAENKKRSNNGSNFGVSSSQGNTGGTFYFYNTQTVGFGQQEFQKIWGNRGLEDNWRLSSRKSNKQDTTSENKKEEETVDQSRKFELAYYLEQIPTETNVLDSISNYRNKAYYNLGLIYKEKFNKYELATTKLEKLLTQKPLENLVLPTYYHLYKAFGKFDQVKSDYYKNKITSEYEDSRYAQLINNPNISSDELNTKDSPDEIYKTVYALYLDEKHTETLEQSNLYIKQFTELPIIPKFELLKAHAIAKLEGKDAFIVALKFVLENHPNTIEGKRAAEILAYLRGEKIVKKKDDLKSTKDKKENPKGKNKNKLPSKKDMLDKIKKKNAERSKGKNLRPPGLGG